MLMKAPTKILTGKKRIFLDEHEDHIVQKRNYNIGVIMHF